MDAWLKNSLGACIPLIDIKKGGDRNKSADDVPGLQKQCFASKRQYEKNRAV